MLLEVGAIFYWKQKNDWYDQHTGEGGFIKPRFGIFLQMID